jgi:ubiquinone/menaquinone biosynthesis C-methylase UbiE
MQEGGPYTFGDGELAAKRLELLAHAYARATRALLEWASLGRVPTMVDLGCGPGHSTRLLCELLGPGETIGLDRSPFYLGRARQDAPRGVRFLEHDVARGPLPVPPRSVLFCRFLLAHLGEPGRALADWSRSVGPGGVLLLQETAELRSELPALGRYYAWVEEMQAHYGQSLYIGRQLSALGEAAGWRVRAARETVNPIPVPVMARLHAMNLNTWRQDPFVGGRHPREELDLLADELGRLCSAQTSGIVESVLGEAVLEALG